MGYYRLALCCVLGFDILPRTGELLSLLVNKVHLDNRINAPNAQAVIALVHTKRGQRVGASMKAMPSEMPLCSGF